MIDIIGTLRQIWRRANQIFNLSNAILVLTETGGTLTADGTEQTVCLIDTPLRAFKPLKVKIDCTDMTWGDTTIIRWYERIDDGGNLRLKDEEHLDGPQNVWPLSVMKNIELEPNRFGFQISLEQTAGTNRDYMWELLTDV